MMRQKSSLREKISLGLVMVAAIVIVQVYIKGAVQGRLKLNGNQWQVSQAPQVSGLSDGPHQRRNAKGALEEEIDVRGGKVVGWKIYGPRDKLLAEMRYDLSGKLVSYREF